MHCATVYKSNNKLTVDLDLAGILVRKHVIWPFKMNGREAVLDKGRVKQSGNESLVMNAFGAQRKEFFL